MADLPENIASTRNGRVEAAARLVRQAEYRLRHAATVLTNTPGGFPIGDPDAERAAETIRELVNGRGFETTHLELEGLTIATEMED